MKHLKIRISVIILVGIDMLSKYIFYDLGFLQQTALFRPTFNTGISRSIPVPFIVITLITLIGITVFIRLFVIRKINRFMAALLIAGTAGNFIDRIFLGGVRDFINIHIFNFPIFNLADIMLTIGVLMRIERVMLEKRK